MVTKSLGFCQEAQKRVEVFFHKNYKSNFFFFKYFYSIFSSCFTSTYNPLGYDRLECLYLQ